MAHLPLSLLAVLATQLCQSIAQEYIVNSEEPSTTVCDATCQRDVKLLEGFIIFVILSLALTVIFFCMHCIDTPTRFAAPRDQRSHQD